MSEKEDDMTLDEWHEKEITAGAVRPVPRTGSLAPGAPLPPEDDLATAEARVIEWAINRIEAEAVSWNTVDRCTRQLDVVTRALIRLRGKG